MVFYTTRPTLCSELFNCNNGLTFLRDLMHPSPLLLQSKERRMLVVGAKYIRFFNFALLSLNIFVLHSTFYKKKNKNPNKRIKFKNGFFKLHVITEKL